uniref:Uncharacterized protein n=1 Tax=Populus trichocarpa TaxID=3694 RepID=A0A2K1X042_POPTR
MTGGVVVDGFIVYDPNRKIISRFDSYGPDSEPKDELVLMDATGNGLLTLHRKFNVAFAMGLVLVLDQMYRDSADDYLQDVDPTSEEFSSRHLFMI